MNDDDNAMHLLIGGIASDTKHILAKLSIQDDRLSKHSNRIADLEKFKWRILGMATAVSAAVPISMWLVKTLATGA
jgi:hypothetical protein